jgi:ligand-binding SRPBCC domain-containing protein
MTVFEFTSEIPATQRELFEFHMDFANVRVVTPPIIRMRFAQVPAEMKTGSSIVVEINQLGLWMPWEISVEEVIPDRLLVDVQRGRGPFRSWRHEHRFEQRNGSTFLTDHIEYQLPFGPLGDIIDVLFMKFVQQRLFSYRHRKTKEYFQNR